MNECPAAMASAFCTASSTSPESLPARRTSRAPGASQKASPKRRCGDEPTRASYSPQGGSRWRSPRSPSSPSPCRTEPISSSDSRTSSRPSRTCVIGPPARAVAARQARREAGRQHQVAGPCALDRFQKMAPHSDGAHEVGSRALVTRGCSACHPSPGGRADSGAPASARRHRPDHRCRARGSRRGVPPGRLRRAASADGRRSGTAHRAGGLRGPL